MGKTYEALERAQKEYLEKLPETFHAPQRADDFRQAKQIPMQVPPDRLHELKTKLVVGFPEGPIKTIMLTTTAKGSGSSTMAASFATTLAHDCRLNVLLIDANLRSPRLHEIFNIEPHHGRPNLLSEEEEKVPLTRKVGPVNIMLTPFGKKGLSPLAIFESTSFDKIIKRMREKFDYVILDAPPVKGYAETKVIGKKVDGVILVIESGKTRQQVAKRAKQDLERAGAKVLGVILNRRKYYIPEWIYKRL